MAPSERGEDELSIVQPLPESSVSKFETKVLLVSNNPQRGWSVLETRINRPHRMMREKPENLYP
jgi:hypothetical protein